MPEMCKKAGIAKHFGYIDRHLFDKSLQVIRIMDNAIAQFGETRKIVQQAKLVEPARKGSFRIMRKIVAIETLHIFHQDHHLLLAYNLFARCHPAISVIICTKSSISIGLDI